MQESDAEFGVEVVLIIFVKLVFYVRWMIFSKLFGDERYGMSEPCIAKLRAVIYRTQNRQF